MIVKTPGSQVGSQAPEEGGGKVGGGKWMPYLCENIEMSECESRVWDVFENKTLCDGVCPFF